MATARSLYDAVAGRLRAACVVQAAGDAEGALGRAAHDQLRGDERRAGDVCGRLVHAGHDRHVRRAEPELRHCRAVEPAGRREPYRFDEGDVVCSQELVIACGARGLNAPRAAEQIERMRLLTKLSPVRRVSG
jgi:hypothetical protein